RFNNSLKSLINREQNIFEGLNIRYFGPFDGHDVETLVRVLRDIKDFRGPRILHLRTVKGKGFIPAEKDPAVWHAPGKFDPTTGQRAKENPTLPPKYQDIFGEKLVEMAQADPRIVAVTAAMPSGTSVSMMQERFPDRTFDVGISEGHAVTFAGGLAKDGMRPYVAIYSSFLQRAYSHIIHDVAIAGLPVTLCLDRAGLVGEDGPTHHGAFDIAYLRSIPGMIVAAPRDGDELRAMMEASKSAGGPMAIRYPRGRARKAPDKSYPERTITIGRGQRLREGDDLVVLTLGTVADDAAKAIDRAEKELGLSVAHYDMRFAKPLDKEIMAEVISKNVPVITVEDGIKDGGMGSAVLEWLNSHAAVVEGALPPVTRLGIPDNFVPHGSPAQLHALCGYDADGIYNAIAAQKLSRS
ncbi:MAG: 1-deoxy-D-xylulose-5-phosphate synthase, partial [Duncaniella sp.]|nr:1-deoxy-D-xylulose-5-phosphate synthase [Duncaniella sp.]